MPDVPLEELITKATSIYAELRRISAESGRPIPALMRTTIRTLHSSNSPPSWTALAKT